MKINTLAQCQALNLGAQFLSTGGGGNPQEAEVMYQKLLDEYQSVRIVAPNTLTIDQKGIIITAFGVGSIATSSNPIPPVKQGLSLLQKYTSQPIIGIVPVEIGPKSISIAAYLAAALKITLFDADFVGGRSSPEVFLETITLQNIPRTPAVITNNQLQSAILLDSPGPMFEEQFFRNFASISGDRAYVVGYPISVQTLQKALVAQTVTKAFNIGLELKNNSGQIDGIIQRFSGKKLFYGELINKEEDESSNGFSQKIVTIKLKEVEAKIYIKNENLILTIDNQVVVTCPDLIIMLDQENRPISNQALPPIGSYITVVALPAEKMWQTKKARRLFSPKTCGYPFESKVLST